MTPAPVSALTAALAAITSLACTAQLRASARTTGGAGPGPVAPAPAPVTPAPTDPLLIAGTPVVRVGVNFEDLGATGDRDYNDAVLCFEGRFKVDRTQVVSIEDQQVVATTSSRSDCRHRVTVEVVHADGSREAPLTFDSRSGAQVPMRFRVGSRLEVTTQTYDGGCGRAPLSMHDGDACQVRLDQCNTTGR